MLKEAVAAVVLLAIASAYWFVAAAIGRSALADGVGAAGLPLIYAAVLAVLALGMLLRAVVAWIRKPRTQSTAGRPRDGIPADSATGNRADDRKTLASGAVMLAIGVVYLTAVPYLGYLVTLAGILALTAWYQGERSRLRLAATAIGGSLAFFVFFVIVLGIDMPVGFWPALFSS